MEKYDVIVIGAGSAGLGNSGVANMLGLKTLMIEKNENNFGGDCTNFGCVPSKALIHLAHQFHQAKLAQPFGLKVDGKADMGKILDHIHSLQDHIKATEDAAALRAKGIDVVIGEARFISKEVIQVGDARFSAKLILLCTGSSPRKIQIEGMDTVAVYTNETVFFDCRELPEHFVVIGGGPIGCELGQAFSRFGSKVTIVNRGDRLLKNEPEKVSRILEEVFEKEGITTLNNAQVMAFKDGKALVQAKTGEQIEVPCDATLVSIGRVVNTKGMDLEKGGVALTERGKIQVNDYLQSTNKKVYVVGDAAGSYMFSHGAEKMVIQLWRNLLIPLFRKKNSWANLSWVTFTDPQVAHFGLVEKQLQDQGVAHYRQDQNFEHDDRAILQDYTYGHVSLWFDGNKNIGRKRLLSGSMIAPQAGELMQEMELAKHAKIPARTLESRVYPYPVATRINQKAIRGLMAGTRTGWKLKAARTLFRLWH
ncbi:dihydrolipoyl dehydrogenase family protein [Spongiimicrobium salis]|uniref:dihydrolipoyl dehydrogenase family protein n=1 Tax=Spongiimicrobium salis TaxID=1667022 RepID=UPI00374C8A0F